jgi:hypothetical protein
VKTINVTRCAECPWLTFAKVSTPGRTDDFVEWCSLANRDLPPVTVALDESAELVPPPAWCPLREGALVRVGS